MAKRPAEDESSPDSRTDKRPKTDEDNQDVASAEQPATKEDHEMKGSDPEPEPKDASAALQVIKRGRPTHLYDLGAELIDKIVCDIVNSGASVAPVVRICRFFQRYDYCMLWLPRLRQLQENRTVVCFAPAHKDSAETDALELIGAQPWLPILILDVQAHRNKVTLKVFAPRFFVDCEESAPGDVVVAGHAALCVKRPYWRDAGRVLRRGTYPWETPQGKLQTFRLDWERDCARRLRRCTGTLLRRKFACPECRGSMEVCMGPCGGRSERWPSLESKCGVDIPCPCCVGVAQAKMAQDIGDEHEKMNKFWAELNEYTLHRYKETWGLD